MRPGNDTAVTGLFLLVLSILLTRLPLFNYLGYEFSAAIGLALPWVIGFPVIRRFRRQLSGTPRPGEASFSATLRKAIALNLSLLAIPILISTLNLLFVKNCSYFEGLLFFLLIPFITCIFSVSLAGFCLVIFRRPFLFYYLLLLAILLHPLYLGYFSPQIYSYNFLYGYFAGFSHDEVLVISSKLVVFRVLTIGLSAVLVLLSFIVNENSSMSDTAMQKAVSISRRVRFDLRSGTLLLLVAMLFGAYLYRGRLGLETSTARLQEELSVRFTTEHFQIYYAPQTFSDEDIRWVAAEHEFRFHQVEEALQIHFSGRIASYIYPDAGTKERLIGTGRTNIAKPWRKEIHLNKESWESTLKHELVHVLAGEFGMPVIKAHYNLGLVEGLATAIDNDYGNHTLHEYGAAISRLGIMTDPHKLISATGFILQYPATSYVMMGSFCKYLIDHYGMNRFKGLYSGKSPWSVYGNSYERLVDAWQHYLTRVRVPPDWNKHVEFYFKRPSIFAKECARAIAKLNQEGFDSLARHNSQTAAFLFSRSLQKSWNTEAFAGLVRAEYQASHYDSVISLVDSQKRDSTRISAVANLLLLYGDALWAGGKTDAAKIAYEEILSLDLSDSYDEAIAIRLLGTRHDGARDVVRDYFLLSRPDTTELRVLNEYRSTPENALISYLKAELLIRQKDFVEASHVLDSIRSPLGAAVLDAGKERTLGESYFYRGKFQVAKIHFWQSLNFTINQATVQKVNDWLERCDWFDKNSGHYLIKK